MNERIVEHTEHRIDNHPDGFSFSNLKHKMKHNPWIVSSIVLGLVVLVLLFFVFKGGITGNVVKGDVAAENLIAFAKAQGADATLVEVNDKGNFYEVVVSIKGQEMPLYVTRDGEFFTQALIPLTGNVVDNSNTQTEAQPTEVVKSDKPQVELYVFTYCPYGTQSEKGIIPAVNLLGNKIDFKIRQIGAMHGEYEKIEAQRQLCIEKNYPTKFLTYVNDFALSAEVGACSGDATCVNPLIEKIFIKLGIDKAKIDSCMKTDGVTLYAAEEANSQAQGVSGSPTLVINGAQVNSGRDSASYLKTICSAFNTAPAECSQTLSSASPSPGFGGSTTASASSTASC